MATEALDSTGSPSALRSLVDRDSLGVLVLTAAIPFLFMHERFQPELAVAVGDTSVQIRLADWALLAVVVAALVLLLRHGATRLRAGRLLWISGGLLLGWLAVTALRPASVNDDRFAEHLVSYLKFVEYALLALAVPLLVRRSRDLGVVLAGVVVWSAVATGVALLQLFGSDIFSVSTSGWRYSSFLGRHDLAALSILAAALAAARIVVGRRQAPLDALFPLAAVAGFLGLVLAGSVAAAGGFAIGAAGLWLVARRRFRPSRRETGALAAVVVAVALGVMMVRSEALEDFLRFVGLHGDEQAQGVETYSQRTVLAYIGLRIAQDNPIVGVGWQRSSTPEVFEPYVPDARARFPDVVDLAFPAEGREWGVQNLYVQMFADAGAIGLVLLLLVGAAGLTLAWRTALRAPTPWAAGAGLVALCGLLTLAAEWA
ncbi:MAG TPA: O-antigen ligase family protein, partial [Gaiellaceae bacterium]|nr:O-antigen ligase family protein [Gaiellaceae bacterium]